MRAARPLEGAHAAAPGAMAFPESFDLKDWSTERLDRVEEALSAWVPREAPAGIGEAMRYAVLDGGKRLRPLLVIAGAEAVGGNMDAALRAGCAVGVGRCTEAHRVLEDAKRNHARSPGMSVELRAGQQLYFSSDERRRARYSIGSCLE